VSAIVVSVGGKIFGFYILRPLKNLTVSANLRKRVDFYEVTGGPRRARPSRRALFFVQCIYGGNLAESGKRGKLACHRELLRRGGRDSPRRYVAEKTESRSLDRETEEKPVLDTKVWVM